MTDTEKSKDLSRLLDILLTMIEKTDLSSLLGLIMEEATKTMHAHDTKEILEEVDFTKEYKSIPDIAAMHHERLDGTGYPYGLKAEQLNTFGRIIAVADIFDVLMSFDRHYKKALSLPETLDVIRNEAEKNHLDTNIIKIFIEKRCIVTPFRELKILIIVIRGKH